MSKTNPGRITTSFKVPARNIYDHSHRISFNCNQGEIIPVGYFPMTPASRLEVSPSAIVKTAATAHPVLTQARCRLYAFWVPDRLYIPDMLKNAKIEDTKYPQIAASYYTDETPVVGFSAAVGGGMFSVLPNSLLQYMGLPVSFNPFWAFRGQFNQSSLDNAVAYCNAHRLYAYFDIFRNYFANRNESEFRMEMGTMDHDSLRNGSGTFFERYGRLVSAYCDQYEVITSELIGRGVNQGVAVTSLSLERLDLFFTDQLFYRIYNFSDESGYGSVGEWPVSSLFSYVAYGGDVVNTDSFSTDACVFSHGGLLLKSYMPDLNSSFIETDKFKEALDRSLVKLIQTTAGDQGISIQDLIGSKKTFDFLLEELATGGQFDELLRAEFGVDVTGDLDIPMLLKVWNFDLNFDQVVGTADENLGELGGRGYGGLIGTNKHGKRVRKNTLKFGANQYGEVHFYMTIEPYVDYSQGADPFLFKKELSDHFFSSFDRIGFQPLPASQLDATTPNADEITFSDGSEFFTGQGLDLEEVGVQPAYTEYMGRVSRVSGDLGDPMNALNRWTFVRKYPRVQASRGLAPSLLTDFSTYISPSDYNNPFKDVSSNGRPYVVSIGYNASMKLPISRNQLNVNL